MSDKVILSAEGYEKLRQELHFLKTTKRKEISEALRTARAHGDLRENAEYDAAKNEQALLEARIKELEVKMVSARIIDESQMATDKVFIGAKVTLFDEEFDEEIQYELVSQDETDITKNRISVDSAVGKALLGKKVEDKVEVQVPAGKLKYRVLKIERR